MLYIVNNDINAGLLLCSDGHIREFVRVHGHICYMKRGTTLLSINKNVATAHSLYCVD